MKRTVVVWLLALFPAAMVFHAGDAGWDEGQLKGAALSAAYAQQGAVDTSVPEVGHRVIAVRRDEGPVPQYLKAAPGTTVVWVNYGRQPIEILFTRKEVTMACKAPVKFVVGEDGAYVSEMIPSGAAASLCFVEKGTFEYFTRKAIKVARDLGDMSQIKSVRGTITIQ
jgi:plastocyanin